MTHKFSSWKVISSMLIGAVVLTGTVVLAGTISVPDGSRPALLLMISDQVRGLNHMPISAPQPHAPHPRLVNGWVERPQPPRAPAAPLSLARTLKSDSVNTVSFSPDGKILATAQMSLQLWNIETGQFQTRLENKRLPIVSKAFFSPKEALLAAFSYDERAGDEIEDLPSALVLWDSQTGKVARMMHNRNSKGDWKDAAFSPDGKLIVTTEGTEHGTYSALRLWNAHTGKLVKMLSDISVNKIVFSPDGKTVAGAAVDYVRLWDVNSGELKQSFSHPGLAHPSGTTAIAFSPDGATLASATNNRRTTGGTVKLWNVRTGQLLHTLQQEWYDPHSLLFAPGSQTLLIGGGRGSNYDVNGKLLEKGSGMIVFYDVASGKLKSRKTLPGGSEITVMALSPDGKTLATGEFGTAAEGQAVKLWRLD